MRRILLTGASGTVGKEILGKLCEDLRDAEITVFDIKTSSSTSFFKKFGSRIKIVYGNISEKNDISGACSDKDLIIHLAAIIPPLADKDPALAKAVNVTGTLNLIGSLKELSPNAFFLYSSSISVYGDRNLNPWIKVSDPLLPSDRDEYARTKIEAENLIMSSGLRWSIFRLTAIMGIDNHKVSELMFHMPLDSCLEIATPGDTARAFINATSKTELIEKKIFNLSGGEKCRISYRDFLSRSFKIFGLGRLNFRENSFAGRNFHCGYYEDGDLLEEILDFRRDTLDDYFKMVESNVPLSRKIITMLFRRIIKHNLQRKSQPLLAVESGNKREMEHYF